MRQLKERRMPRFGNLFVLGCLTVALCLGSTGSILAAPGGAPARGGTLVVGISVAPIGFDPALETSSNEWQVMQLAYESLIVKDARGRFAPALATSWNVSPDGLTYTFHLRKGVLFHDGAPMTSADVAFSFRRMQEQGVPYVTSRYKNLTSIETPDPDTVVFHFSKVEADFLNLLSDPFVVGTAIVSQKAVTQDHVDLKQGMVGTGPYKLQEYVPGDHITFTRFDKYWDAKDTGYLDSIVLKLIPDMSSELAALRSGRIQLMFPDAPTARLVASDRKLVLDKKPGEWRDGIGFNTLRKPFQDVRVRQAISVAINREVIAKESLLGAGSPTGTLPLGYPGAPPFSELANYQYNLARAKRLLAEAGLADGFSFRLTVPTNYPANVRQGEIIQQELKAVGIDVSLDKVDYAGFLKLLNSANYDASVYPYASYPDVDLYLVPRPGRSGPTPADMAALFAAGEQETNPAKRAAIYTRIAKLQAEECFPVVWLVAHDVFAARTPAVHAFDLSPTGSLRGLWTTWLSR